MSSPFTSQLLNKVIDIMGDHVYGPAISAAFWTAMYQVFERLPGFKNRPFAFVNRSLAILHALVAMAVTTPLLFVPGALEIGGLNTKLQLAVVSICYGYFSFDLVSWLWNGLATKKVDWMQIAHHSACVVSLTCAYRLGRSATDCALGLLIAEAANPFMYMRYLLWVLDMSNSALAAANMHIFMLMLTITVPICGPILSYLIVTNPNSCLFHQVGVTTLIVLNLYWYKLFLAKYLGSDKCEKRPTLKQQYRDVSKVTGCAAANTTTATTADKAQPTGTVKRGKVVSGAF